MNTAMQVELHNTYTVYIHMYKIININTIFPRIGNVPQTVTLQLSHNWKKDPPTARQAAPV